MPLSFHISCINPSETHGLLVEYTKQSWIRCKLAIMVSTERIFERLRSSCDDGLKFMRSLGHHTSLNGWEWMGGKYGLCVTVLDSHWWSEERVQGSVTYRETSFTSLLARASATIYCRIPPPLSNIFHPFSRPSSLASRAILSLLILKLDLYSYIFFTLLYPTHVSNLPIPKAYTIYSSLTVYIYTTSKGDLATASRTKSAVTSV